MAEHACETFDFPVKQGSFEFNKITTRKLDDLKQVLDLAKAEAQKRGTDAMDDESCKAPCWRDIYVETKIDSMELNQPEQTFLGSGPVMHDFVVMSLSITWQAGILCIKRTAGGDVPKAPGGPGGKSGGE